MRALILAAGHGSRLGALSQHCPKPLQPLGHGTIISRLIGQLQRAGIEHIVINLHHLGNMIQNALGDGQKFGLKFNIVTNPNYSKLVALLPMHCRFFQSSFCN